MTWRELTDKEKRMIRMSVQKKCACYDPYYGCLPLDADCYMTKIGFTNSSLCRYYEKAVLPDEPDIMVLLSYDRGKMRMCKICGRKFVMDGNRQYCSDHCSLIARRKATARRDAKSTQKRVCNVTFSASGKPVFIGVPEAIFALVDIFIVLAGKRG